MLFSSAGFLSTQCFSVTVVHDVSMGKVILDRFIRFLDGQKLAYGLGSGVSVYLIHRSGGFGPQEVSHPVEHMGHKSTNEAYVPGAITYWKTLETNKWSRCSTDPIVHTKGAITLHLVHV